MPSIHGDKHYAWFREGKFLIVIAKKRRGSGIMVLPKFRGGIAGESRVSVQTGNRMPWGQALLQVKSILGFWIHYPGNRDEFEQKGTKDRKTIPHENSPVHPLAEFAKQIAGVFQVRMAWGEGFFLHAARTFRGSAGGACAGRGVNCADGLLSRG